jgi:hypothetical protein
MFDPTVRAEFDRQFKIVRLLYFAMLSSLGVYLGIGTLIGFIRPIGTAPSSSQLLIQMLYIMSAVLILAAFLLKRRLIRPPREGSTPSEIHGWLLVFRNGHLVSFALCEAIGIFGLLALFLAGSKRDFVKLVILAFASMVLLRPTRINSSNS